MGIGRNKIPFWPQLWKENNHWTTCLCTKSYEHTKQYKPGQHFSSRSWKPLVLVMLWDYGPVNYVSYLCKASYHCQIWSFLFTKRYPRKANYLWLGRSPTATKEATELDSFAKTTPNLSVSLFSARRINCYLIRVRGQWPGFKYICK